MLRTEKLGGDPDEDEDDEKDPYTGMYKVCMRIMRAKSWALQIIIIIISLGIV